MATKQTTRRTTAKKQTTAKTTAKKRAAKLGFQGRADWLDLSDYLVHFAKGENGYDTMMSILSSRVIRRGASPFGCATKNKAVNIELQRVACLSEIPLGFLQRIVKRRKTPYGIGFHKRFILKNGGAPLWYLELGSPQQRAVSDLMKRASKPFDPDDPIWKLTPFIDFPSGRPFAYDFRWEREWRVPQDLHFSEEDVAFLFIPEESHNAAWVFFENAQNENLGPGYFCPYIDPMWNVDKVREALVEAGNRVPPPLDPRPPWPWW